MSPNLDLLRAYAVLVVLVAHLQQFWWRAASLGPIDHEHFGRWGVLVFFVHTSLVLMRSLERTPLSGADLMGHFYVRRAFRIYPLSLLAIGAVVIGHVPRVPYETYEWVGWGHLLSNAALTTNLTLSPEVLGPLWSLPYEIQMYAVLPLLFWLCQRFQSRVSILALWACSVILATIVSPSLIFRAQLLQYVPCFLGGVVSYVVARRMSPFLPAWGWPVCIGGIWLGYAALNPGRDGWAPCLLLGLSIPCFREVRQPAVRWIAGRVAKYSYGIYLAHLPLIWLVFGQLASIPLAAKWALFCGLIVILPVLLFHLVEQPMIEAGERIASKLFAERQHWPVRSTTELRTT